MIKSKREYQEQEDRTRELTVPKLLARAAVFGTLAVFLFWGPWALVLRLLICASGALAYMALSHSTPLRRHM
jgi:hypothetical protein